ncbi:MAG: zf-HC2 domain-containing protein [Myxococcales bacterium]|nr:zf-HC2 domain-containing protein [Myxococcales bacterium]
MSLDDRVAGISCREVLAQLGDYQDGGLAADARAALEAHVGACANCAAFGGAYGGLVARLRERLTPRDLDAERAARLAARLAQDE